MIEKRKLIHQGGSAAGQFCYAVAAGEGVAQEVNHAVEDVPHYIKFRSYGIQVAGVSLCKRVSHVDATRTKPDHEGKLVSRETTE